MNVARIRGVVVRIVKYIMSKLQTKFKNSINMKNLLTSLISLSALLLSVTAQFPVLSPSYTISGTGLRTESGQPSTFFTYEIYIDIDRQLRRIEESDTTSGVITNFIEISSANDQATYTSVDEVCADSTTYNPNLNFPLDTNVWELYAAGTESPVGTYTFTRDNILHRVEIEDGLPTLLGFAFGNVAIAFNVDSFRNPTPAFSTFSLPSECSRFSCLFCYQNRQFPVLSPSYTISGSGLRTESGQPSTFFTYEISIDIDRQLQRIEESDTTSGVITNFIEISSANDQATYTSVDEVCADSITYNPSLNFPLDTNVWELYAAGTESPVGTYTFTRDNILHRVEIEDGLPTFLGFAFGNVAIAFNVDSFRNTTPAFSTFCLPSECSANECIACYSGAAGVASSVLLILSALLVYLMTCA